MTIDLAPQLDAGIASVHYFPLILNSSLFDFCCHHFSHLATLSPCHPFFLPLVETQSWKSPTIWSLGSHLGSWAPWEEITQLFSSSAFSAEAFHSGRKLLKPLTSLIPPHSHLLFNSWFTEKIHRCLHSFMPPNLQFSPDLHPSLFSFPLATKETKSV